MVGYINLLSGKIVKTFSAGLLVPDSEGVGSNPESPKSIRIGTIIDSLIPNKTLLHLSTIYMACHYYRIVVCFELLMFSYLMKIVYIFFDKFVYVVVSPAYCYSQTSCRCQRNDEGNVKLDHRFIESVIPNASLLFIV